MPKILELREHVTRQIVLPTGSRLQVPTTHKEWVILAMAAFPNSRYRPPDEDRDPYIWGDVQIRIDHTSSTLREVVDPPPKTDGYFRVNALTLMDRYWGRYNLNTELCDILPKLEQAQHAVQIAPTIRELAITIEAAIDATRRYLHTAAPDFPVPIHVQCGDTINVELIPCECGHDVLFNSIDVELLVVQLIPVVQ